MAAPTKRSGHTRPKNRQTKTFLEFNDKARSEYLLGFQKRKQERKKIAREKNDNRIIEERKAFKRQFREQQKTKGISDSSVIPEIKHLIDPQVFNLPEHTVTIADFGDVDFVGSTGLRLGKNTGQADENNAAESTPEAQQVTPNVSVKSFQKKLSAFSNQMSSQKLKARKESRKQHLKAKSKMKKKGKKNHKGGKKR